MYKTGFFDLFKKIVKPAILIACLACIPALKAQEMVYVPVNPSFGGSPYNSSWLLSAAQAQDRLSEGRSSYSSSYSDDPLADFESSIKRQILNQLSREFVTDIFGEEGVTPGQYEIGDFLIEISESLEGINIQIWDNSTGSESTIVIPYY